MSESRCERGGVSKVRSKKQRDKQARSENKQSLNYYMEAKGYKERETGKFVEQEVRNRLCCIRFLLLT